MAQPLTLDFASIPKYCINLARRPDRRAHAELEFKKVGLEVEFVTAVDGNDLVMPELSIKNHEPYAKGNWGCVLSHLSIIKRMDEVVFICEDDVKFTDTFPLGIREINYAPEFDILYLGGDFKEAESTLVRDYFYRVKQMGRTHAYILRRPAGEFIARNITYDYGIDEFYSRFVLDRFVGITYSPALANQDGGLVSDIGGPR